jgi:hypothetical protein
MRPISTVKCELRALCEATARLLDLGSESIIKTPTELNWRELKTNRTYRWSIGIWVLFLEALSLGDNPILPYMYPPPPVHTPPIACMRH